MLSRFLVWVARPRPAALTAAATVVLGALPRLVTATGYASDLGRYYRFRDLHPGVIPYLDRPLEYPVVTGFVIGIASQFTRSPRVLFLINVVLLAGLAALLAWFLARRYGTRVARFAAAPPLALAGPVSWDLVAVVPATLGLLAFEAGAPVGAGVLIGLGIAAKVFPLLFLPPLLVDRIRNGAHRAAFALGAAALATVVVINVPVALLAPSNWRYFFTFQSDRVPTWGAVSSYVLRPPFGIPQWLSNDAQSTLGSVLMLSITAVVVAIVCVRVWRRRMSPTAAILVSLVAFLLSTKIYSPQYDLWVLPFFVLLPIARRRMYSFWVVDAAMFVAVFGLVPLLRGGPVDPAWVVLPIVLARAVVLVAIAANVWSSPAAPAEAPAVIGATP